MLTQAYIYIYMEASSMNHKKNITLLYTIFLMGCLSSGVLSISAQAQQKCNTFKTTNYKFQLSTDKKTQANTIVFNKSMTDRRSSPPTQKNQNLELKDDTGFLSAYVLTVHLIQQAGQNKETIKQAKHLKSVKKIFKYIKKLKERAKKIKTDITKNKKLASHQDDINKFLQYTNDILKVLKSKNINIEALDKAFDSIISFPVDEEKIKNGIGVFASVRQDQKKQWSQKQLISDLKVLPPLFVSGKRKTKSLCNRSAKNINVHVELNNDVTTTHSKSKEIQNEKSKK